MKNIGILFLALFPALTCVAQEAKLVKVCAFNQGVRFEFYSESGLSSDISEVHVLRYDSKVLHVMKKSVELDKTQFELALTTAAMLEQRGLCKDFGQPTQRPEEPARR